MVNWNGKVDTLACLDSLAQVEYANMRALVVDNGSQDGSVEAIRSRYPNVELLEAGANLGFVGANNAAMTRALELKAGYVFLLNNDTVVAPDFLARLVELAEADETLGAVGPLIYYHSQPEVIWSAGGSMDWQRGSTEMIGLGETDRGQFGSTPYRVDFITGCAMLVKAEAVRKAGLLDESFFAYYEEVEWCVRIKRAGYEIALHPGAKIWHKITPEAREASPSVLYYMTRNRLLFLKKTGATWRAWWNTLVFNNLRTLVSWSLRPKWRGKREQRKVMWAAIRDFFRGKQGAWER